MPGHALTTEEIARNHGVARVDVSHALVWLRIEPVEIIHTPGDATLIIAAADVPRILTHIARMRERPTNAA